MARLSGTRNLSCHVHSVADRSGGDHRRRDRRRLRAARRALRRRHLGYPGGAGCRSSTVRVGELRRRHLRQGQHGTRRALAGHCAGGRRGRCPGRRGSCRQRPAPAWTASRAPGRSTRPPVSPSAVLLARTCIPRPCASRSLPARAHCRQSVQSVRPCLSPASISSLRACAQRRRSVHTKENTTMSKSPTGPSRQARTAPASKSNTRTPGQHQGHNAKGSNAKGNNANDARPAPTASVRPRARRPRQAEPAHPPPGPDGPGPGGAGGGRHRHHGRDQGCRELQPARLGVLARRRRRRRRWCGSSGHRRPRDHQAVPPGPRRPHRADGDARHRGQPVLGGPAHQDR